MSKSKNFREKLRIRECQIIFRNFAGKEGRYNQAGDRNFSVLLDNETAETLEMDGWNIKWLIPKDENADDRQAHLPVKVSYKFEAPTIVTITENGKMKLNEEQISRLDRAEIKYVDLVLHPSKWKTGDGITAYVESMWVTLKEDEFEMKYRNIPDTANNSTCSGCRSIGEPCTSCTGRDNDD